MATKFGSLCLLFAGLQYGTCFMLSFWGLGFLAYSIPRKFMSLIVFSTSLICAYMSVKHPIRRRKLVLMARKSQRTLI